jgi:hypothetical protein
MRNCRKVYGFIYIWTNQVTGMKYLGKRWGHVDDTYIGSGKYFRRAWKKYGAENFTREIVDCVFDKVVLKAREQFWLDFYDAGNNESFYNISSHAGGGHHGADYNGSKNPMFGKKHPNHRVRKGTSSNWYGWHRYGEANPNARNFIIVDNNGVEYRTKCLKQFVCEHFGAFDPKIYSSLQLQAYRKKFQPARAGHCKGWKIRYDDAYDEH